MPKQFIISALQTPNSIHRAKPHVLFIMEIQNQAELLGGFIVSMMICAGALGVLSTFATKSGWLLDKPSERKHHLGSVTLVGGIGLFITFALSGVLYGSWSVLGVLSVAAFWLVLVGLVDDAVDLSSGFRFLVQTCAVLIVVFYGDVRIESIGRIAGQSEVLTGSFAVAFTVLCTLGVINAINMIDGLDGLSSGIAVMTLASLLVIASGAVDSQILMLIVSLIGALLAFFVFNMGFLGRKRKVFMGDAGSTFIGFVLAWLFITLSQSGEQPLSPVVAGWLFGLPLLDSISVMVRRAVNGQSPFKADRRHLHHELQAMGLSARTTLVMLLFIHFSLLSVGVMSNGNNALEPVLFWAFVLLVIIRHFAVPFISDRRSA